MSPPTECVPVYHPLQIMSMDVTPNRIYPSITLTEHTKCHVQPNMTVTPIHVPECRLWPNLSLFLSVIPQENLSLPPECLPLIDSIFLSPWSVHNRVCLCLLSAPYKEKKNVISRVLSPVRTYPHPLCARHLIAHGPGSWFACCAVFVFIHRHWILFTHN